jgi:hypothetical protein
MKKGIFIFIILIFSGFNNLKGKVISESFIDFKVISLPISEFSELSYPGTGIGIGYRARVNPYLGFNFFLGFNYFFPKTAEKEGEELTHRYNTVELGLSSSYYIAGFNRTFSPWIGLGLGFYRTGYSANGFSDSSFDFTFNLGGGVSFSLLEFGFIFTNIFYSDTPLRYIILGFKYRIPINE